jgi:hypothetical protein
MDFSPASIRAVQTALLLADRGATIILAHIPSPLHFPHPVRLEQWGCLVPTFGLSNPRIKEPEGE